METTPDIIGPVPAAPSGAAERLVSIDAYRGLVMLLLMAEVLRFCEVARAMPDSAFWQFLCFHQSHAEWIGCSLHDLIQPSFSFLAGVALPFSLASRAARGQRFAVLWGHALWRSLLLILLGVFLRSMESPRTNWTFEDTLSQIGLGYGLLFLLGLRPARERWIVFGVLLAGYWAAFAVYPVADTSLLTSRPGVSAAWLQQHGLSGFAAHWQKNANLAWAFDRWFLNLFPREKPFLGHAGGYATLSFIPTLATMILGLLAGSVLRTSRTRAEKLRWLALTGASLLAGGWLLGAFGLCPVVKRIWTPSWVLFSGGWCCLLLGAFHALVDAGGGRRWVFPLKVIGMNSIAAYLIAHLFESFIAQSWRTHLGSGAFLLFGLPYEPLLRGAAVLLTMWLILCWMYRRRLFLRI